MLKILLKNPLKELYEHSLNAVKGEGNDFIAFWSRYSDYFDTGLPFTMSHKSYPTEPTSDTLNVVLDIYQKWRHFSFDHNYELHLLQ